MSGQNPNKELYNLRWSSFSTNLLKVFSDLQNQENLVDVTLSCEGKFIKAHRLVLAASSSYFQNIFDSHPGNQLVIFFNEAEFKQLKLIVDFMYTGEVKVANSDLQKVLKLGKRLQVKGLCGIEIKQPTKQKNVQLKSCQTSEQNAENSEKAFVSSDDLMDSNQSQPTVADKDPLELDEEPLLIPKKRKKCISVRSFAKTTNTDHHQEIVKEEKLPSPTRPPNAFMIFTNQWRQKLTAEYPNETTKQISLRLCNMWKSLSHETRESFYEDARKAEQQIKLKNACRIKERQSPDLRPMDPTSFVAVEIHEDSKPSIIE